MIMKYGCVMIYWYMCLIIRMISGLSPEGIHASDYNRAKTRRHLCKLLYPAKSRRYLDFCSSAIGLGIVEVQVIHTI
ncbi:Membrane protein [Gossypium arboreum]|uniref:Membrane protein n=1 Tax=Gossypium arboreum TaxID=29729 RepID=A0A0B0P710_GOSAR|nr:Membrane protein [Gossypium arboreum]